MLKPPHPAAVLGYVTAMLINPNNHALDGGPATAQMEKEVVARLATMFGFDQHLGHLTSSGTIANLEALWAARESHPGKAIAYSADAHYTHSRMCQVIGVEGIAVGTDAAGRMDLAELERVLATRAHRHGRGDAGHHRARRARPAAAASSNWPAPTARASTSTRPTAASSR